MALDWSKVDQKVIERAMESDDWIEETNAVQELLDQEIPTLPPQMSDFTVWDNYIDEELYVLEKKLREYFESMRQYAKKNQGYQTTAPMVFNIIFGRPPQPEDRGICVKLNRLLNYYSYKITGKQKVGGKWADKVYWIRKYGTEKRRPMSIKLRMEWTNEQYGQSTNQMSFTEVTEGKTKRVSAGRAGRPRKDQRRHYAGLDDRNDGQASDRECDSEAGGDGPQVHSSDE